MYEIIFSQMGKMKIKCIKFLKIIKLENIISGIVFSFFQSRSPSSYIKINEGISTFGFGRPVLTEIHAKEAQGF